VITCVVRYVIDPAKTADFERFAARWIELVERHGGCHRGYSGCVLRYDRTFMRPLLPATNSPPGHEDGGCIIPTATKGAPAGSVIGTIRPYGVSNGSLSRVPPAALAAAAAASASATRK
jgi:hypothetical protein